MPVLSVDGATRYLWKNLNLAPNSDCAVWIGSGLSAKSYPSWEDLIGQLCRACGVDSPKAGAPSEELIDKVEECKQADERNYYETLTNLYADPQSTGARQAYAYLSSLNQSVYVTTNYDPILYSHSRRPEIDVYFYDNLPPRSLGYENRQVYYIHGMARRGEDSELVLARSEFDEAYDDPGYVTPFLLALFRDYDMLFVGCSLSEPPLQGVFRKTDKIVESLDASSGGYDAPTRIILLPLPEEEEERRNVEESRLRDLNISVVWYRPERREVQGELEAIFEGLCDLNRSVHRDADIREGL